MKKSLISHLTLLTLAGSTSLALAAVTVQQPDAGRTSQELKAPVELPKPSIEINIEGPAVAEPMAGGAETKITVVKISGNTVYDEAKLLAVLGEVTGKTYDLAGLKAIANVITTFYRTHGYPFARAFIPAQSMKDGELKIEVVEGRYGEVKANGSENDVKHAQAYLTELKTGAVIDGDKLERAVLILSDLPGVKTTPILSPGKEVGTGDLDLNITRERKLSGEVGLDNYGNRYTGRIRGHVDVQVASPFTFGDQLNISSLYTEESLWFGSLKYALPIGGSGLKANVGYAHTYYELGKEFSVLDANGTAQITNVGLSYPVIRTQDANLSLSGNYQYKKLEDNQDIVGTSFNKFSNSLPISLSFDLKDQLLGGGITYGVATFTTGRLNLDSSLAAGDVLAKTAGSFSKFNLEIARAQALPANFSFLGKLAIQAATDNLDSSEKFGLGGVNGVRAYPSGEGFGDEGALARFELNYAINKFNPYAFYDAGTVKTNHNSFDNSKNRRTVSGAGLGIRVDTTHWSGDASLAWRTSGGAALSDSKKEIPMFWVGAKYKF